MNFYALLACGMIGLASGSGACAWTLETERGQGTISIDDGATNMLMRCTQRGPGGRDDGTIEWRLVAPALLSAVNVTDGAITQLTLEFDGSAKASGPFMRQGTTLATGFDNGSPLLARLRGAAELSVSTADEQAAVQFDLAGLGAALDGMLDFCATPAPEAGGVAQDLLDTCDKPAHDSARTICTTTALRQLETELAAAVIRRRDALSGPPLDSFAVDQGAWEALRESCGTNTACLENAARGRIAFLARLTAENAPPAAQAPVEAQQAADLPPLRIAPVQPVLPAQFGGVLYDNRQITQRVIIEAVRQQPLLLSNDRILQGWHRVAIEPGRNPRDATAFSVAREHLSRSVAAQPPGPFVIAFETDNPFLNAEYDQGVLALRSQSYDAPSPDLGRFQVPINGLSGLHVRATSQFDISKLQVGEDQARSMQDSNLRLLIVAQIDKVHVIGSPDSGLQTLGEGQVRFTGLKRRDPPQPHGNPGTLNKLDPALFLTSFAPTPPAPPSAGLATFAERLGVRMHEGALLESGSSSYGSGNFGTLLQLVGLGAHAEDEIGPGLRAFSFNVLADPAERDAVIPPVNIESYRNQRPSTFPGMWTNSTAPNWRAGSIRCCGRGCAARLPKAPLEVIAQQQTSLGEYDRALGGFPIRASVNGMGMAAQGGYPALKSIPDLLPLPLDQARELVSYFDTNFGPGYRSVSLVLRYRIDEVGPVAWEESTRPDLSIKPLALSLHVADGTPYGAKIAEFDLAAFRGDPPPVASAERVAFWKEINETARSTTDDVTLAALAVSEDDQFLAEVIEDAPKVNATNDFDKPAAREEMRAELAALDKPRKLVLAGSLSLSGYSLAQERYGSTQLRFRLERGDMGLRQPSISLSAADLLAQVDMPQEMARISPPEAALPMPRLPSSPGSRRIC